MPNSMRIRIAAAATALFIAALSATGLAVRGTHQPQAPPAAAAAAPSTHTAVSATADAGDSLEADDE